MTVDEFWEHIDSTRDPDPYEHAERLVQQLARLPVDEILDFDYWWVQALHEAYTAKLWAAADLISGGLLDDAFEYFRARLILRGRHTFDAVVADPDVLAGIVTRGIEHDELSYEGYPGHDAWLAATGSTYDDGGHEALTAAAEARHGDYFGTVDLDDELWYLDDEERMRAELPRLAAMFLTD